MVNKTILVPIAHGTEEMEAVIIIDMLRRAGIKVIVAGDSDIISCSRAVKIIPDILFEQLNLDNVYDAVVLPGGLTGTENLRVNTILEEILLRHHEKGILIGAICAAPTVLSHFNILKHNSTITSHPSVKSQLIQHNYLEENVVLSGNIITSRGAGTAFDFSLKIIEHFCGSEKAKQIADSIVLKEY
ncbi:MAG: DJ-1 family glyoxalase III [bacterium]